jgi:membrane protein implicated in regulation of membrane protease activity
MSRQVNTRVNGLSNGTFTKTLATILGSCVLCSLPLAANAYVGPGAGLSLLGALWALIVAVGAAVVFLFAWPIRRMRRRKREARELEARERDARGDASEGAEGKPADAGRSAPGDTGGGRQTSVVQPRDLNEPRRP